MKSIGFFMKWAMMVIAAVLCVGMYSCKPTPNVIVSPDHFTDPVPITIAKTWTFTYADGSHLTLTFTGTETAGTVLLEENYGGMSDVENGRYTISGNLLTFFYGDETEYAIIVSMTTSTLVLMNWPENGACTFVASSSPTPQPQPQDLSRVIPGHWRNVASGETIGINYNGSGTIALQDLVDNDWGVTAYGTYTLSGSLLTANYTRVEVLDVNWNPTTYHGFTDGRSKVVKYTIVSCDGSKLVMKNESGVISTYNKYAGV